MLSSTYVEQHGVGDVCHCAAGSGVPSSYPASLTHQVAETLSDIQQNAPLQQSLASSHAFAPLPAVQSGSRATQQASGQCFC
jgi:hypothetical protein